MHLDDAAWVTWPGTGLEGRDLGLEAAWHRDLYRSGDLEVGRLTSAAQGDRFDGFEAELPLRAATLADAGAGAAAYLGPASRPAPSPGQSREVVRDLGSGPLTGGRVSVRVRTRAAGGATPGPEDAPVGAWLYVVSGEADVGRPDGTRVTLRPHDALSSDVAGGAPRVLSTSPGFVSLELHLGPTPGPRARAAASPGCR